MVELMAESNKSVSILFKSRSWSPHINRNKEWEKLKAKQQRRYSHRRSKSVGAVSDFDVTDDDIQELRACIDLGFGFDPSNDLDPKLTRAFPALELYAAVNRQFLINNGNLSRSSSMESDSSTRSISSSNFIVDTNDDPKKVKTRLKRWAQVVACSIHEASTQRRTQVAEDCSVLE